ncbi:MULTISPECIES: acyl-CoA-like ligand-binding transcription factor [unclassified Geodermatophilus]
MDTEPARLRTDRGGRPAVTTPHELAAVAQQLFVDRGFDATSVEDIATAAGIGRRTFFRYFPTKADVLFVESDAELRRLEEHLAEGGRSEPYQDVVTRSVVAALRFPDEEREWARQRAQLLLTVPAVQAHAMSRYAAWRAAAAAFVADRSGQAADALFPRAVGQAVLAATLTAHEHWLAHPESDLFEVLARCLDLLLPPGP